MSASASKYLGYIAVLVSLGTTYVTQQTYADVIRYQSKAQATYYAARDAWTNWRSDIDPGKLPDWVQMSPASVTAGINEVRGTGTGTLFAWLLFTFSKWSRPKEDES